MYNHIVMAVALDHEHDLAQLQEISQGLLAEGGKITALHVFEELPSYASQYVSANYVHDFHKEVANDLHHKVRDMTNTTPVVVSGHAGRTIVDYGHENGADCIVIASHQPGLEDYFLGSTAARVVRHAKCSVHVIR